jgi:probable rRNA maturation factor
MFAGEKVVIFRKTIAGLSPSTLERFVLRARKMVRLAGTANILITNNSEMRSLNRRFRKVDKPTDVLSFPSPPDENRPTRRVAGEIAISVDIARENARRLRHPVAEEIKILTLHGVLHLAGFDHENDKGEMARKELHLRQALKLNTGLIERAQPLSRSRSARRMA